MPEARANRTWRFDAHDWKQQPVSGFVVAPSEGVARYKAKREMATKHHRTPHPWNLLVTEITAQPQEPSDAQG
jgi:hypothetical protein